MSKFQQYWQRLFRQYIYLFEELDTDSAAERIKNAIWFRGPNVWILAFSVIIASVGLNVNSTAVIIGAMLISPLMGPIIGTGLALGTNDTDLLKSAAKNLLVMVVISLLASTLFFLLSPLSLVNPTELEARTSPTLYDVLIALFGGLAGILENSRKERGTVLSGVAIATALMPPLCTAGYGLAHLNMHFFIGALYLFVINSVFIALATYLMVKYLRFRTVGGIDEATANRRRQLISTVLVIVVVPSILSAYNLIIENNFERSVRSFVEANRMVAPERYIYNYNVEHRHAQLSIAGDPLTVSLRNDIYQKAARYGIKEKEMSLNEHALWLTQQEMQRYLEEAYSRDEVLEANSEAKLAAMQSRIDELSAQLEALRFQTDSLLTPTLP